MTKGIWSWAAAAMVLVAAIFSGTHATKADASAPEVIHVDELNGLWTAVWTRRPGSDVFDAVWHSARYPTARDIVRLESITGDKIVFTRDGFAAGRYTGTLSADGTYMSGSASWYAPEWKWSARITAPNHRLSPVVGLSACPMPVVVPPEQVKIHMQQREWLESYRNAVEAHASAAPSRPVFGAHLLTADSNRGDALLQSDAHKWVDISLDRFREMGVTGITLNIGYPMLLPSFPDSAKYLDYYRYVADAVHKRGMTLTVEQIVLYTGSQFTPFAFKFTDMSVAKYTAEQTQMAQIVIDNLRPDYLTIFHEPDTIAGLIGLNDFLDPAAATTFVKAVLAGVRKGTTLIGAGSGSWSDPAFAAQFAKTPGVDYIDIHIYWIDPASVARSYEMAQSAKANGKPVIISEAGLYKSIGEGNETGYHVDGIAKVYSRDVFGFWEPLDMAFIDTTARFARSIDTKYMSIYWTNMFFSYADWTDKTKDMSYAELNREWSGQHTAGAWLVDRFTCAAKAYEDVIAGR